MNRISAFVLFLATTFATASFAPAQDRVTKATVPFSFTVGDTNLPAGNYRLSSDSDSNQLVKISNWEKKVHLMTLGLPDSHNVRTGDVLVFHEYGGQYFLTDIRCASASMNYHFYPTKAEKRAKAQAEEAKLVPSDPVLIALNR